MNYVFYAKIHYYGIENEPKSTELFTIANNYAEAATQIENSYSDCLMSFSLYCFDNNMLYVDEIADYLKEARGVFNEEQVMVLFVSGSSYEDFKFRVKE